jgi:hypothetical protein
MFIEDLKATLNHWIKELDQYDFTRLCMKPSPNSWSVGQVYMHLIDETEYYLEQAKICASMDADANQTASPNAQAMFLNNSFPDEILEGPPTNAKTCQPASKEQLLCSLLKLKDQMNQLELIISTSSCKGKTRHPGLEYFGANEWIQFADMHLRHHLSQKKRIDEFLKEIF